jgi:hypothetical protein
MQQFFAVLSALLCTRFIEWIIIATVKTYKDSQDKKLIERVEKFKRDHQ